MPDDEKPDDEKLQVEKLKRLTIDLTAEEHRYLKKLAAEAGISMRNLVLQTLRREGLLSRSRKRRPSTSY